MLNQNTLIDSPSKIDSLLDEFAGELTLLKSIPSRMDDDNLDPEGEIHPVERLLYDNSSPRPPEDSNYDVSDAITKSFSLSPIPIADSNSLMEEIDLFLTPDDSMPPGIETDHYDSEGDILFFEELLTDDSLSLPENELLPTQPTLCPVNDTLIPFSSENEDKVHLLSHRGFKAFQLFSESPMMIYGGDIPLLDVSFLHFYPP
ncbi:hypothetical protein Tco_0576069 [Tanacetum coccineum]